MGKAAGKLLFLKVYSVKIAETLTLILGAIIMGVGYHAYIESTWNKFQRTNTENKIGQKLCTKLKEIGATEEECPNTLPLETYFVTVTTIAFISSVSLLAINNFSPDNNSVKRVSAIYSIVAFILVFTGGATLLAAAVKINNYEKSFDPSSREKITSGILSLFQEVGGFGNIFRSGLDVSSPDDQIHDEKLAAGILSLFNGFVYLIAGVLGIKASRCPIQNVKI